MVANLLQQVKQRFGIVGNASSLNNAIMRAIQVAETDMGVLIMGENGSGKELFAKIMHHLSVRKHGKFIAVNCGAIPEGTIDSELFGHEKGAFTSASDVRKGYFEEAYRGTVFLDEIGEMPLPTQPKLLRVLETKEYMRVGSSQQRIANVRVVAATNVDLQEYVTQKRFREDLYYRIAQVQIRIPPLRDRGEDIYLLFRKFALAFSEEYQSNLVQLTPEAKALLMQYSFPGNVRQLRNITREIATFEKDRPMITKEVLIRYLPKEQALGYLPAVSRGKQGVLVSEREMVYKMIFEMQRELQEMKRVLFELIQDKTKGSKVSKVRPTLFNMLALPGHREQGTGELSPRQILSLPAQEEGERQEKIATLSLKEHEKLLIKEAIEQSKSYRRAAQKLGISERTLYRKVNEYNLSDQG